MDNAARSVSGNRVFFCDLSRSCVCTPLRNDYICNTSKCRIDPLYGGEKHRVDAGQPVNVSLGRTTKEHAERSRRRAADLVARCMCERQTKGDRIDVGDIVHFRPTKLSRLVRDILVKRGYSAGLLQVAANDVLLLGESGAGLPPELNGDRMTSLWRD